MANMEEIIVGQIVLQGITQKIGTPTVTVMFRSATGKVLMCTGATKPTDGDAGYATGCLFIKSDDGVIYHNLGSDTSANFDALADVA